MRVVFGVIFSFFATVAIAFIVGCALAVFMMAAYGGDFVKALVSGNIDAFQVLLAVGLASAALAAVVSVLLAMICIIFVIIFRIKYMEISRIGYVSSGIIIAAVLGGVVILFQSILKPALPEIYWFEFMASVIAGPVCAIIFWYAAVRRNIKYNIEAGR